MKKDKLKGLMWGSLLGDAYTLGGHWIYDQRELENSTLKFDGLNTPLSPYHPTRKAGDFTHYGNQTLWLLEYMTSAKNYDPFEYGKIWQENMSSYEGYVDSASSDTLRNLKNGAVFMGAGSESHDLSIVGRHAPIIFSIENIDEVMDSVKLHTFLTHFTKEMLDVSKYITEVTLAMLYDLDVETTLKERAEYYGDIVETEVKKAFEARNMAPNDAIKFLGQSCNVKGALASTIYLILNYHNNFDELLKVNVLAGGDSAARGMVAGILLGARYGFEVIKPSWIEELNDHTLLNDLIT